MHQKLTEHGKYCMGKNQLLTRTLVELKGNSIVILLCFSSLIYALRVVVVLSVYIKEEILLLLQCYLLVFKGSRMEFRLSPPVLLIWT